jgi:GTPase SAR1 family protein
METVPILLVGTKSDLRTNAREIQLMSSQGQQPVQPEEAEQVAKEIGARQYLECSAKTRDGVREVFNVALREAFGRGTLIDAWGINSPVGTVRKRKCVLL